MFEIMQFVLWILIGYGITQIIVDSTLFTRPRDWASKNLGAIGLLFNCFLCTSVWVFAVLSIILPYSPAQWHWLSTNVWINPFLDAMIGSTAVWFLNIIEHRLSR